VGRGDVEALASLIDRFKPGVVLNLALPYRISP
jgi:hypothetical protein